MEVLDLGLLSADQAAQLEGDEHDPFDAAGITLSFRPKERHVVLAQDGRLIASAGLTRAEVTAGEERFGVCGLGGVIVNAERRGEGLARSVVELALERAAAMGPRFALLFCHANRAGLYERLGFTVVAAPVSVEQPGGFVAMSEQLTMSRPLLAGAVWPDGPVTVHGLPF